MSICAKTNGTTVCVRPEGHDSSHLGWRHGEEYRWEEA